MHPRRYPKPGIIEDFLSVVNNPELWPVCVHCARGRHRTGVMTAVYRMTQHNWTADRAYEEMKEYGFFTRWGHGALRQFVHDFYRQHKSDN